MVDYGIQKIDWLECIINNIPFGLVAIDLGGKIISVSQAYCDLIGYRKADILGNKLIDLRPEAKLPMTLIDGKSRRLIVTPQGMELIVEFRPLVFNNEIIGAISCGQTIDDWNARTVELLKQIKKLKLENKAILNIKNSNYTFNDFITQSPEMRNLLIRAERIAKTGLPVLISGESGTGKEILAQSIHNASNYVDKPYIAINCAAVPPSLLESELFGYEAGAFTGANKTGKAGLFEIAENGTIFLDEIGEMAIDIQAKLLRVLQEKKYRRVGGTKEYSTNCRIISATNQDLEKMIDKQRFREDLYYRLNAATLNILPLRNRKSDIPLLIDHFLMVYQERFPVDGNIAFQQEAIEVLEAYDWPGNVRELKNVVEYAICMSNSNVVDISSFPEKFKNSNIEFNNQGSNMCLRILTDNFEAKIITDTLNKFGWDLVGKKRSAEYLKISLGTLYNKIKILGIKNYSIG